LWVFGQELQGWVLGCGLHMVTDQGGWGLVAVDVSTAGGWGMVSLGLRSGGSVRGERRPWIMRVIVVSFCLAAF